MLRFILLALLASGTCYACDCVARPTCGDVRPGNRYFIGTPISMRTVREGKAGIPVSVYTIRIIESLSTNVPASGTLDIIAGPAHVDCSWIFQMGASYLIEAVGNTPKSLFTSHCNWTGEIHERSAIIRTLRDLRDNHQPPSLLATVVRKSGAAQPDKPLANIGVTLQLGSKVIAETLTDSDGVAAFKTLGPGDYKLTPRLPGGLRLFVDNSTLQPANLVTIPPPTSMTPPFCRTILEAKPLSSAH